jgi:hypothetical protein
MKRDTDYLQQLANYIKKNLSKGYTLESLKWALVSQGYGKITIDQAISFANEQLAANAPRMIEKPVIKIEKVETIPIEEKKGFWKKVKDLFN